MNSYTFLAESYDELTGDVNYQRWADYIEWHFARQSAPVKTVLDLACGTGSLTRLLAERGYRVIGADRSEDMLCVAEQKCRELPVLLLQQDMSRLTLPEPTDAVVCCLDSINYVTRPAALRRTFQRVFQNLRPDGLFLFDAKTPLALTEADGQTYLDENEEIFCVWRGEYYPRRRVCGYGMDLFRRRPDGAWERGEEYHEEYAYTPEELEEYLKDAGFARVKRYGCLKKRAPAPDERRVFFAAGKDGAEHG